MANVLSLCLYVRHMGRLQRLGWQKGPSFFFTLCRICFFRDSGTDLLSYIANFRGVIRAGMANDAILLYWFGMWMVNEEMVKLTGEVGERI